MERIRYNLAKMLSRVFGNRVIIDYFRRRGMKIGQETRIFSCINSSEPYLIEIGDHCTIATSVTMLTHDASVGVINRNRKTASDLVGKIEIGNHCFIGAHSIILYGVTISDKVIIAAGSVVTKSITTPGVIVGGNPAKVISSVEEFKAKNGSLFLGLHGMDRKSRRLTITENVDKYVKK